MMYQSQLSQLEEELSKQNYRGLRLKLHSRVV